MSAAQQQVAILCMSTGVGHMEARQALQGLVCADLHLNLHLCMCRCCCMVIPGRPVRMLLMACKMLNHGQQPAAEQMQGAMPLTCNMHILILFLWN